MLDWEQAAAAPLLFQRAAQITELIGTSYDRKARRKLMMQLNVPPDLEALINKRLSSGGYASVEDVLRRALEAQDAEESWTDEERQFLTAHIEKGFLQAERGELIDGAQARREIQELKEHWQRRQLPKK